MKIRNFLLLLVLGWPFCNAGAQSAAFSSDAPKCQGTAIQFTPASPGGTILSETWDFGDGTSVTYVPPAPHPASPAHVYSIYGIMTVVRSVTFTTGQVTASLPVLVWPNPVAAFNWISSGCYQEPVQFMDYSFSFLAPIVVWEWNFGNPGGGPGNQSNLQNPVHYYPSAGSYPVQLVVYGNNGCVDTVVQTVAVTVSVPSADTVTVSSLVLAAGHDTCLAATNRISLAGDGGTVLVQAGGHADLVAGSMIRLRPDTRVDAGGYLHGRITTTCDYCSGYKVGTVNTLPATSPPGSGQPHRIYPNPVREILHIVPAEAGSPFTASLYRIDGEPVYRDSGNQTSELAIAVADLPNGMYLLRLCDRQGCRFYKIIKD